MLYLTKKHLMFLVLSGFYIFIIGVSYLLIKYFHSYRISDDQIYDKLPADYRSALILLAAQYVKHKQHQRTAQIKFLRSFFEQSFPERLSTSEFSLFNKLLTIDIPFSRVLFHIRNSLSYGQRMQLLHFLSGLISVTGTVHQGDISFLRFCVIYTGINENDYYNIYRMYFASDQVFEVKIHDEELARSFHLLEVPFDASEDEVRKAYRKKVRQHHPDYFRDKSIEEQQQSHEYFLQIDKAFKNIMQYLQHQKSKS